MKYFIAILICFVVCRASAQQGAYIPPGGKAWIFGGNNAPVALFGNMQQEGTLGSNANALLYFLGKKWTNGNAATLPDETGAFSGIGGTFRFSSNNILYGNIGQQTVFGNYSVATGTGASFPNLELNNPSGLLLDDLSDLKVRRTLQFTSGHIFLNGWNLVVGNQNPGIINGYSDQRFVVTGTGAAGGFLYREGLTASAGRVVFPVGTDVNNYAPAAIDYQGSPDMFNVRVFDSIYLSATSGPALQDTFISKTWNIGHTQTGHAPTDVILQHMNTAEMPVYATYRDSSYINRYNGNASWDRAATLQYMPQPGTLTTQPFSGATMHFRSFSNGLAANEFFSKTVLFTALRPPATIIYFQAWRLTWDKAHLEWSTNPEVNNYVFEIERRFEEDTAFTTIAKVPTKAPGGYSKLRLDYTWQDNNNSYDGWTYYRIKAVGRDGQVAYSVIRAVPPLIQIDVFPNPNLGQFKVRIRGIRQPLHMQLINNWGQVLRNWEILNEGDVQVKELPAGLYYLLLYNNNTKAVAYRTKVVVLGQQ
jgi:hypothetical protein